MKDWWQRQGVFGGGWWPWVILGLLLGVVFVSVWLDWLKGAGRG